MEEQKLNFHDYDIQLRKVKEKKNKKYTNSYTTRDIFYIIQKNIKKLNITIETFSKIVKSINQRIAEKVIDGETVYLPSGMGRLSIGKSQVKIIKINGKYASTGIVDWKSTKKLWYEDEEAARDKIVIYFNQVKDDIFRFQYSKRNCRVKNLRYYVFRPHRKVKIQMKYIDKNNIVFEKYGKLYKR